MSDFGFSELGFRLKRLADVRDGLKQRSLNVVDPKTGEQLQLDFDEDSPDIQIIDALAETVGNAWEMLDHVTRMFDPSSAVGVVQSAQVQLNGIRRRPGLPSSIEILLNGTPGTQIEAGQRISDVQQNVIYLTSGNITIGANGTATGSASSEQLGPFLSLAGTVTTILTPVAGWSGVTNIADSVIGQIEETDEELRLRRDLSTEVPSQGPVEALRGNLLQVNGVEFVAVYINNTLEIDGRGIPPKTVTAVVQGGQDEDIAKVMFLRSATGVDFFGNTALTLWDKQGEPHEIRWLRPEVKAVYVEIDIQVINPNLFGDDGEGRLKQAIVTYAQDGARGLGIQAGFDAQGFLPGEDVARSRLYTPINSIAGHIVTSLKIGLAPEIVAEADLQVGFAEIAIFDSARIIVNIS